MTRFQKRRARLRQRRMCTRCAVVPAENGRCWCTGCLAIESDKRDARTNAEQRRQQRLANRRARIVAALERLRAQTVNL